MDDPKLKKDEKQPVATIKVEEVTEKKETKIEPEKPQITVKQRIDEVVDKYEDKEELKKQVFQLVQHILYPEQFCPSCDERMFFIPISSTYNCPNCGYQSEAMTSSVPPRAPTMTRPAGKVPEVVEKAIAEANQAGKEPMVLPRPTKLGEQIRKLVNDRDAGGPSKPTKEDEARIHNADKNASGKVNWV